VNESLVIAVPAKHDRGICSSLNELRRKPRGDWCLARTSDAEVADTYDRHRYVMRLEDTAVIKKAATFDNGAIRSFEGR
jgi:hypothetical protein